jgi:hypothetical protein
MELKLGQLLIKEGLITAAQLEEALRNQVVYGVRLGSSLIEMGCVEEDDLGRLLSQKLGVPFVGSKVLSSVPKEVIRDFSRAMVIKYHVLPFKLEGNRLGLAMTDPNDYKAIEEIAFITGHVVQPFLAPDVNISRAQARYYRIRNGEARYQQVSDLAPRKSLTGEERPPSITFPALSETGEQLNIIIPSEFEEFARPHDEETVTQLQIPEQQKYSPEQLAGELAAAGSRDAVADLFSSYISQEFMTGALFMVRKRVAVGWRGVRDGQGIDSIADLSLDLNKPSVLRDVVETRTFSLGTLHSTPQNLQILELLAMPGTASLFVVPICMRNKAVALVLVAADMDDLGSRLTDLQNLVKKAALAFEMLIIKNKILTT